jgi:glutamyl/glutaminyl-tRNA synthetase
VLEARPERWGDAVIVRKDATSYHLAVVIDDAWQGVTHVTCGHDLSPRRTCIACFRCLTCRSPSTITIA